jgi:hypothetical protein
MSGNIEATIANLASEFVARILSALREASLGDLETTPQRTRATDAPVSGARKRIRRSPAELQALADKIVAVVKRHPKGIKAEELKRAMGVKPGNIGAKVFTKPLALALASKRITKRGHRRATTYHAK